MPHGLQQATNQRGFSSPQIAIEINDDACIDQNGWHRLDRPGQGRTQSPRRDFILQQRLHGKTASFIITFMHDRNTPPQDWKKLATQIKAWGSELGFDAIGITSIDDARSADTGQSTAPGETQAAAETGLKAWLAAGFHGEMDYMARHGLKRARPDELTPGASSVISARLSYWPEADDALSNLADGERAYISRYALGRDYHKLLRSRLQKLADRIEAAVGTHTYRAFTDSAPVLEVHLANRAGLGWRGKHTLLLTRDAGSAFFIGEIVTALPLPADPPQETGHCGRCTDCLTHCPTGAIIAPWRLDARRCISYLTIELQGSIPTEFRPLLGNRIYGCDDCQLYCPWQKNATLTREADFSVRHHLDRAQLVDLFAWTETEFKERMAGSPIYRIGHECWLRNIAVALGNAPTTPRIVQALQSRLDDASELVREHVAWALSRHAP